MDADMDGKSSFLTGVGKLLAEGPFELLTHIQLFLNPVDILALRFTCKHLSGATRSRIVWVNALRNVSIAQGVFLPSFPVEQMSNDDLEHAALSPRRLLARFQKAARVTPFLTRLFTPHLQGGDLGPNLILAVDLVPGGRFLVTSNRKGELHLWDIGYNTGGHMKSLPVATLAASEARPPRVDHIRPGSNSDSLYVFTNDWHSRIFCYEIYPTSENPCFSRLGTLWCDAYDSQITSSKDYLVCYQNARRTLIVWKYAAKGLGVSWVVSHHGPDDLCEVFIFDKNVITFHTTDFCLWTIPDLTPLINGHAPSFELEPKLRLAYLSVDEQGPKVALPSRWLPELAQNQFGVYYDEILTLALYQIKSVDTSQESDLPNILPIHSGSVPYRQSLVYRDTDDAWPLHITEDGFLQTWITREGDIAVGIILIPRPNIPTQSIVTSSIWEESNRSHVHYDFCPMAGRLIVRSFGLNGPEIQIVDFMPPRSSL
ncbi:uncharacterized protein LACBIDRAFT_309499 [Laccaria bicolor S238N-H82]|uniref:Predicted protein n=1 Tax=Laccaria bicolor (strain S238N-H82 / ATCC MYA-4686) TaxID=486041 RepID=B0DSG4_LACBS|nr:uncharacterized protein LACBIDRAFT_309499 [Laccaria bicolor S238N-H82]EDR02542.1 predicted protein [Laccaria bicolor S238N-H82]|eukprot:XP_001886905.1 predicted protein [Laccaria bicolor S238N-H82]